MRALSFGIAENYIHVLCSANFAENYLCMLGVVINENYMRTRHAWKLNANAMFRYHLKLYGRAKFRYC